MDIYTLVGFYATIIGTVIGFFSLIYAIYISKTATKIKNNLMSMHIQNEYKKSKKSLLTSLSITYKMAKDDNIIDHWTINEVLIEVYNYRKILSKDTIKTIKKLDKIINNNLYSKLFELKGEGRYQRQVGILIYELIKKLQTDFDEKENWLEVITK